MVRSIEFVIKVGAGTVKTCLVLNYRDKRHIYDNSKTEIGELKFPGIKRKIIYFILLSNVTTYICRKYSPSCCKHRRAPSFNSTDSIL
jgi:hypothetical protein